MNQSFIKMVKVITVFAVIVTVVFGWIVVYDYIQTTPMTARYTIAVIVTTTAGTSSLLSLISKIKF